MRSTLFIGMRKIFTLFVFVLFLPVIACTSETMFEEQAQHPTATATIPSQPAADEVVEGDETTDSDEVDHDHDHGIEIEATYLGDYLINDEVYGTQTTVTVNNGTRTIQTNALPNHDTGKFPNSGNPNTITEQSVTYTYTTNPVNTGSGKEIHVAGVAVNGIKLEPGTAETVACNSGERYRVEGLQDSFDLGMDFNNAHVQPTGAYHYHGISELLIDASRTSEGDLVHIGFAADGYLLYASSSAVYAPSYELNTEVRSGTGCTLSLGRNGGRDVTVEGTVPDGTYTSDWVYNGSGNLDECNGTTIHGEYAYVITESFPYIPRCLMGEFTENRKP